MNGSEIPKGFENDCWIEVDNMIFEDLNSWKIINGSLKQIIDHKATKISFYKSVNMKRIEMLTNGVDIDITNYGLIPIQCRIEDQVTLQRLAFNAEKCTDESIITFRDRKNIFHKLSPKQIIELWNKSSDFIDEVYHISWKMKDSE